MQTLGNKTLTLFKLLQSSSIEALVPLHFQLPPTKNFLGMGSREFQFPTAFASPCVVLCVEHRLWLVKA